jgi:glutathione S-transferase
MPGFRLVSHHLCPYVQRVAIALREKGVAFERIWIDLANKPEWFLKLSPLGKVPLLETRGTVIFESAVILEYLEDTQAPKLHPADSLARAVERGWIEYGSAVLTAIGSLYNAKDAESFEARRADLAQRFARVESELGEGPWFRGNRFSLVDAVFAPVFRYFDVFDEIEVPRVLDNLPKVMAWRRNLAQRPSVIEATPPGYGKRLEAFLAARNSYISGFVRTPQTEKAA